MTEAEALDQRADELISYAWTIIANASEGNWEREAADWQEAAKRWRDQYHSWLDERGYPQSAREEPVE